MSSSSLLRKSHIALVDDWLVLILLLGAADGLTLGTAKGLTLGAKLGMSEGTKLGA
jgi:hypothetical protein